LYSTTCCVVPQLLSSHGTARMQRFSFASLVH
jgi:hypothetical protein